jgi:hypothetical protein
MIKWDTFVVGWAIGFGAVCLFGLLELAWRRWTSRRAPILTRCACGRAFTERKWGNLTYGGIYDAYNACFDGHHAEFRECPCGRLVAVVRSSHNGVQQ